MERLTNGEGRFKGIIDYDNKFCNEICDEFSSSCDFCPIQKAILKLIEYEDTKLQPKQVEKLKTKYKELQKENRKLKKEMLNMLKYAWYNQEDNNE